MKKLKIKLFSLALLSVVSVTSCNRYLDINVDPNNIPSDQVTPNLIFPGAITTAYRTQAQRLGIFSGLMMNAYAGNSYSYGTPFVDEYTPNVNSSFYADIWDNLFRAVGNFDSIDKFPNPNKQYDQFKAASKIMKAYYVQILTDLYGDMPYSEAFKYQNNLNPKYDKGEDIYKASIADLEAARALIDGAQGDKPGAADIVFGGNMASWKAFSYNLELRYLIRMSKVTGPLATYRDQKLADIASKGFYTNDITENPGYSSASDDKQNPFFNLNIATSTGSRPQNYLLVTASENIAIALNGNPTMDTRPVYQKFNGIVDGRRGRIFTLVPPLSTSPAGSPKSVEGVRQGATPGQDGAAAGRKPSSFGAGLFLGNQIGGTLAIGSARSGMLMSKAEIKFLLAEAAIRYPALFSNAPGNFTDGVSASFAYLGAAAGSDATYLAAISAVPSLGILNGSVDNKIEAIMTQKWIALTGINPEQSFFDYSRTGYPITPLPTVAGQAVKPNRLVYPSSEFSTNSANVPNIASADVFTKNQFTPFWNRN